VLCSIATGSAATEYTATAASINPTTKTWPTFLTTRHLPSTWSSQRTLVASFSTTIGQTTASG